MALVGEPQHVTYQALAEASEDAPIDLPEDSLRRMRHGHLAGGLLSLIVVFSLSISWLPPPQPLSADAVHDLKDAPVIEMSVDSYTVPSTCLGAMLLGALAANCCCAACHGGECCAEGGCGCCGPSCWVSVFESLGCVPTWTLASFFVHRFGGIPCFSLYLLKGLLFSGCGFLGGVTLTGAAAIAGLRFCRDYNDACGGCVQ
ncbi:unnamed protein product [Symbiodinium natans]|uniref:Transmembrane protein n=1 Tax=Symbiodinium natans TaxID=878477 RepID=A0A812K2P2_9DINO|nr:unnamed protein product [Symbiodinium natans]